MLASLEGKLQKLSDRPWQIRGSFTVVVPSEWCVVLQKLRPKMVPTSFCNTAQTNPSHQKDFYCFHK